MATSRISLLLETNDVERVANAVSKMASVKMAPGVRDGTLKLLDTFDWLLHRSDIMLRLHETKTNAQLILSGPKYSVFSEIPFTDTRWAYPSSFGLPFLDRQLLPITSNRALIVQGATSALSYNFKFYDAEEMDVAAAWLYYLPEINHCSVLLVTKRGYESFHRRIHHSLLDVLAELNIAAEKGDPFEIVLYKNGRSPRDYQTKFSLKVDASTYGCIALGQALAGEELRARQNAPWLKEHPDPEFLHDFRVAMRRTISFIRSLSPLFAPIDTTWLRSELKLFINTTSPIRDLENLNTLVERQLENNPNDAELSRFRSKITEDVSRSYADLIDLVPSSRFEHLLSTWDRLARQSLSLSLITAPAMNSTYLTDGMHHITSITPKTSLADCAQAFLLQSGASLIKKAKKTKNSTTAESLHRLRKEVKTFRYLLEFFEPVLDPAKTREVISRIKKLQDSLGQHQDSFVQLQLLAKLCKSYQIPHQNISVLFEILENDQLCSIESYAKEIESFSGDSLFRDVQLATAYRKK